VKAVDAQLAMLTDEEKDALAAQFRKLLDEAHVEIDVRRGIRTLKHDYASGYKRFEPTNGRTITIKVNGGAKDIDENDLE